MDATIAPARPAGPTTTRSWVDVVIAVWLLVPFALLTDGWFSADEVVVRQQIEQIADTGGWILEVDAEALAVDPDSDYPLLARSERFDGSVVAYARHPLYPLLMSLPYRLLGIAGIQLVNLAAIVVAAISVSWAASRSRIAFWLMIAAAPTAFHVGVLWAHAPAYALTAAAGALLFRATEVEEPKAALAPIGAASAALLLAALLRTEVVLLALAISIVGIVVSTVQRRPMFGVLAVMPMIAALATFWIEPQLIEGLIGTRSGVGVGTAASGRSFGLADRLEVLRLMTIESSVVGSPRSFLRVLGLGSLAAGTLLDDGGRRRVLLGAAVVMYVAGFGSGAIPSIGVGAPLLVAAVLLAGWQAPRTSRLAFSTFAMFFAAVVATSYDNVGGGDWGARYLFVGVPLLVLGVVSSGVLPSIPTSLDRAGSVLLAGCLCAAVISIDVLVDQAGRSDTVETVDAIVESIETVRLDTVDPVVVVSDERLARFLYDRNLRGAAFHVQIDEEANFVAGLEPERPLVWVDLADRAADRPGEVAAEHGSVVITVD